MRFRTVAIAAVVLAVAAAGGLAVFQIAEEARGEAAQASISENDSLAVEKDIEQTLVARDGDEPTRYGDTVTVVYDGTEWEPDGNYSYNASAGTITFLRDEPDAL